MIGFKFSLFISLLIAYMEIYFLEEMLVLFVIF